MPKKSTPTTSQTPLNPITDFNTIPEREELIVNLQYRRKIYPFKIWNLTGIENDNLEKERGARIKEWGKREPKPKTEVKGGQDIPKPDAEYKAKYDEWESAKNAEIGLWYEYKLLELGLFNCSGAVIPGDTEQERIEYVRKTLGVLWTPLAMQIYNFSTIQDVEVKNFT
ncbi:MAG: hypothetical protein PHN44_04545 [Candidatus Marinimicrobia bacterium]|jgi:hypothetical protein|nr:hypothetical protein [Candidatus Neomarinimicrobiota bacterium]MDD5539914.1 hypothetical protein [Candidatus Neomarinimicrobiota bacterium]